ncbi:hypothetical protein AJ79_00203 [Helicocarpus griseus UAMH5409]|uniref:Uncharacterized protein n=1 Tax=Helicocarpus griseus UAMH5409 TaxID=1447875 RepID=A0A2B7YC62_9EURO|nr:hypothetical protein AJ79_00203 [Helicocarpus griseus UAMH5409]
MPPTSAMPTQMFIFPIKEKAETNNPSTREGRIWSRVLDIFQGWEGFHRLYWGIHVEEPEYTEIHVVRDTVHQHYSFLASKEWQEVLQLLEPIFHQDPSLCTVRHALISDFTPNPKALGKGAPFTGTAIYLISDTDGWEKAWALWTTIVPNVPGCMGVTGGWMVEPVEGEEILCTSGGKDFRKKGVILQLHNHGFREYGHVAFTNSRSKREANL